MAIEPDASSGGVPDSRAVTNDPDMRFELTSEGIRRIWALYSEEKALPSGSEGPGLLELLRSGCGTIALSTLTMLALGILYLKFADPIYGVTAQLVVGQRTLVGMVDQRLLNGVQFVTTQAEILSSPNVVREAVAALPAEEVRDANWAQSLMHGISSAFAAAFPGPPAAAPDPVREELDRLTVDPVSGSNVLALSYLGHDPVRSARFVEELIKSYQRSIQTMETSDQSQDSALLERRERELRAELDGLEARYEQERDGSQVIGEDLNAVSVQKELLARLAGELVSARAATIGLQNQIAGLEHDGRGAAHQTSESRERLREELWRTEAELEGLRATRQESFPDIALLKQKVDTLKRQLAKMDQLEVLDLKRDLATSTTTEKRLADIYAREVKKAGAIDSAWVRQRRAREEIEQVSALHNTVVTQLRTAQLTGRGLQEGRAQTTVHVLEPPALPTEALWPRPLLVLVPSGLLGALLGLGLVVLAGGSEQTALVRLTGSSVARPPGRATLEELSNPVGARLQQGERKGA